MRNFYSQKNRLGRGRNFDSKKFFEYGKKVSEFLLYSLIWVVKILGTVVAGIVYGLAIGVVFISKELWRFYRISGPHIKRFIKKYVIPFAKQSLIFSGLTFGRFANFLIRKSKQIHESFIDDFVPWVFRELVPYIRTKSPLAAEAVNFFFRNSLLFVFQVIKVSYLSVEFLIKSFKGAVELFVSRMEDFFEPRVEYYYEHKGEVRTTTVSRMKEFKLFIFWLLTPVTNLIPDSFEKGILPSSDELRMAARPTITFSDFKQLIRDPRRVLLRKTMASWMVFFVIVSSTGILSFTPFLDWLFGGTKSSYAAPFTGAVRVSLGDTTLSTNGGWLKAMAFSGESGTNYPNGYANGDGDYFQPIHPGGTADAGAAGTLAAGTVALPTTTANNYDAAGAQFIPWRPNASGNNYGVMLALLNTNTVVNNTNVVVELLRFPSASFTGTPPTVSWSNYVACSAINTCTYPTDTVIERRQVVRFDETISGETLYPGQYGIHYLDFRFDPPLAVDTASHYGFRVYYNNLTTTAGWPRNGATKPLLNATNFGLGVTDVDTANSSTVTIPLANTTTAASAMVAINSAPAVGQAAGSRTQSEHWTGTYSSASGNWTIAGSMSGVQSARLTSAINGGTGASWVNDGVSATTLSADATASTRLCVSSVAGFATNQYIDIWDSDTASIQRTIASVSSSDTNCSNGPSITVTATLAAADTFTVAKNATVARATWKLRVIQGAEEAITQVASTTKVCVNDATGFSAEAAASNNVNVWDNNSAVTANRITTVTLNDAACTTNPGDDSLTLATALSGMAVADNARIAEISSNFSNVGTPNNGDIFRFTVLNMGQNPAKSGAGTTMSLLYGKTVAPATSAANYPWISNLRHPWYVAYGDADTAAPTDGDFVIVGAGAADPDANDSTNLSNDLLIANTSGHTVTVDKNFEMPMVYTGATGGGVADGTTTVATASYGGSGFVSMLLASRSKLAVDNSSNQRYRLVSPGRILLSSDASLEFGSDSDPIPQTSSVDLYLDSSGPSVSTTLSADCVAAATSCTFTSVDGFYIGDIIEIKDANDSPSLFAISRINTSTRVVTFLAAVNYYPWVGAVPTGFTYSAATATVSRGPDTVRPTGAQNRAFIYGARGQGVRNNIYSNGSDDFRLAQADLAVDIDGNIDTGYLSTQQTFAGNTWMDVDSSEEIAGNWSPLDPISVAQGNNAAVSNWDSSLRLGANDDANAFPVWAGATSGGGTGGLGYNVESMYNTEMTEIGTIPLTNIYNADYNGGSPSYSSNYQTSSSWTIFGDGANNETGDAVYFGDQGNTPIYALEFNIGSALSSSSSRVWEYYKEGSGWTEFTPTFGWKNVAKGTNNYGVGEYCIPFNASPTYPTATVQLTNTNTMLTAGQWVKIKDDDSPTVIRRISSVTAGAPANIVFTEIVPSGYTTGANAKICVANGGSWMPMEPSSIFSQTGRTMIYWNSWITPGAGKTSINGASAYWVRNRISNFTSWNTSPTNQTTPVGMQGVENINSSPLTVSNSVNEAKLSNVSIGASFDPNETWVLRYNDNSSAISTLRNTRWNESQTASWGYAHRWLSPNPGTGKTSAYYEMNAAVADWRTENGSFGWGDYSVTSKVYLNRSVSGTMRLGIFMRQDADDYGYAAYITPNATPASSTIQWYSTAAGDEGTSTVGSATTKSFSPNTWYCMKAQANGTGANNLQAKFWAVASAEDACVDPTPGTWDVTATSATYSNGRFGLACNNTLCRFDDVEVKNIAGDTTYFSDNFNDTGCWNVIGSIHGSQGCAYNSVPFTSSYVNFTMKHKGGVQSGETGAQTVVGPLNTPEQGDEIYLSPLMRGSSIGLDETSGIVTSNVNSLYENWDFVYNASTSRWDVTGSQTGAAGSVAPGSIFTAPDNKVSLEIKSGTPTGPKFGSRAAYLQNSYVRGTGNFTGLNTQNSAIMIQPYWTVTGSATGYNIEGSGGVAAQKGTIDFWFKPNFSGSPDHIQSLFDYAANSNTDRITVRIMPNGVLEAVVAPSWGSQNTTGKLTTNFNATAGQWYHFRLAWEDSDAGQLNMKRAWLDGQPFTSASQGTALGARAASAGIIRVGNSWQYNTGFDGAIDELAIFDDAIDTSAACDWGASTGFTVPSSAWTGGATAGCVTGGSEVRTGTNIFLTHFDTQMEVKKGFQNADYFVGYPVMVFTNGADTITNDRIRVTTYPESTRIWVDSTGSPYTPAARIKYSEGYALGSETGWGTGFQYHHRAFSSNASSPITSPVLNLRKQIRVWSDEEVTTGNRVYASNQGQGFVLYNPKELDVNDMEISQNYYGFYINGNPQRTTNSHLTQYINNSSFNNIGNNSIYTISKTLGRQVFDGNNFASLDYYQYPFREDSSSNITLSNSNLMGYSSGGYLGYFSGGRVFNMTGNKFFSSYYPVWLVAGTAKIDMNDNEFWRFKRGLTLNGNSFVTMSNNTFDGGTDSSANNGIYGSGIYVVPGTTNVEISDEDSAFGKSIWNESDVSLPPDTTSWLAGSLLRYTGEGSSFNSNFHYLGSSDQDKFGGEYLTTAIPGVDVRVGSGKDIVNYTNFGNMRTTGAGLADTTVRTAGGYAWRLESTSETDSLEYSAKVVGVEGSPLAVTGYIRINSNYGTENLPTVTLEGLGMTGPNLTWTAAATPDVWQQFVVSGTPTESSLAKLTLSAMSSPVIADSGTAENVDDAQGITVPTLIEDADKNWTWNQWAGYKMRDSKGFIFDIIGNTSNRVFLKGTRIPFSDTLPTQPYGSDYEIFYPPYVYLDDVSVLSGTVDTGTLDFHTEGQPVSVFLNTGITAEAIWGAQYSSFTNIDGSFGQLLSDSLAVKRGLVSDANASTTVFETDLTETASDFYKNQIIVMMSGLNSGLSRRISTYNGVTKEITIDSALPYIPAFNDEFVILSEYAATESSGGGASAEEIAEAVWEYVDRRLTSSALENGGSLATSSEIQALQADVTYIKNQVDSIYTDTQYISEVVDDIMDKWGAYDASNIMTDLDTVKSRIGQSTDLAGAETIFGRTKYLQEKWGVQTAQSIYDKADDTYDKVLEVQGELGYSGGSSTAYEDLQDILDYVDEIEGYTDSLETLVGLPTDLSTSDTLFGRVQKNSEAIAALNDISAADVWGYGTKTLTGGVTLSNPEQVWSVASAMLNDLGSVGKLVVDNLDVAVSTRGTSNLTAADVWSVAERTVTGISDQGLQAIAAAIWENSSRTLTEDDVTAQKVWDTLLSTITTTNSIGVLLKTNIDGQISETATSDELAETESNLTDEINQNEAKIDLLIQNLISAQSAVNDSTPTTTQFSTNLTNTNNDFYNNGVMVFTSGLNAGQVRRITDYDGSSKTITVEPAFTLAPLTGDNFTILSQTAYASLDAGAVWSWSERYLTSAQLDTGSLVTLGNLQSTEANLSGQITQTQKVTVGKIINQDTSVKSGNSLTILFRADSGLLGASLPKISVWNPSGNQVLSAQDMSELGSTGVYKYALTFESAWGTGQFTVQCSESVNSTNDAINITVSSTDLATLSNSIDLLASDLISIRSTVSTDELASTVNTFDTDLTSAVEGLYNNALITFISGSNAGVARRIESYNGTTKVLVIEPDLPYAPVDGDMFTILKQVAVPVTQLNTMQSDIGTVKTDVASIKVDIALIKARLDNIDANIASMQNNVSSSGDVTIYKVEPSETLKKLNSIASAINTINTTVGKLDSEALASLLSISEENLTDTKYIKNKLADFKAVTTVQRQVIEKSESPVVSTWMTSGSVDLNIMVSNPASVKQKVPFKVYLPKEAKMEHIMENGGLDIQYDVQLDTLYVAGEIELGPNESIKKTVKMRDIWQISEDDLNMMKTQAEDLFNQLEKTQFSAQGLLLRNDLETRIEKIRRTQGENIATPADKIMTYRENKEDFAAAQKDLDELKTLVTQSASAKGFLGAFGGIQTITIWGIVIAFVTGFGLMIMILFMMWRHQMRLAGGQLALQSQILGGVKLDKNTIAQIMADGTVTKKERAILKKKGISESEITKLRKRISCNFGSYIQDWFGKFGKKIAITILALTLIIAAGYILPRIVRGNETVKGILYSWWGIEKESSKSDGEVLGDNDRSVSVQDVLEEKPAVGLADVDEEEMKPMDIPSGAVSLENSSDDGIEEDIENKALVEKPELKKIRIKETPTGWLNVREDPSKSGAIVAKVNAGEEMLYEKIQSPVAQEKFSWYYIKLNSSTNAFGWVYGEYVEEIKEGSYGE